MTTLDVALRLRLVNQLSAGAKTVTRELQGIKTAAQGLNGSGPDKLKRDILDVATASRQAGRGMQDIRREATALGSVRGPERLKRDILDVASAARQAERSLAGARAAAKQVRETRGRESSLPPSGKRHPGGATVIGGTSSALGAIGGGYLGYRTVSAGVRSVVDQDKAWAEVQKKVNATPRQFETLQVELRRMAVKYGMSVAETFRQAAAAGAAGTAVEDIPEATRIAMMGTVAWDTNAVETMKYMTKTRAAMGWTWAQTKDWADKVNAIADASEVEERDLISTSQRSFAPGKAAGVDADTVMAITGAQMAGGMPDEVASRWFNTFSARLAGAHAATKKQREALKKYLGIDPDELANGMEKDARTTILNFLRKFQGLPQKDKIAMGVQFFGQEWWDETVRATNVMEKIGQMLDLLNDKTKWSGSMEQNLAIKLGTIASHWDRIAAAANNAADALDRMSGLSRGFKEVSEYVKSAIEAVTKGLDATTKRNEEIERKKQQQEAAQRERSKGVSLKNKDMEIAIAEQDLATAEAKAKLHPLPGRDAGEARNRVERLRLERAELQLAIEAMKARPELNLQPSPEISRGTARLPHKPLRRPVDLPPVLPFEDIVPRTAEGKVQGALDGITQAIAKGGEKAVAESRSIVDRIKALFNSLNFTVSPTISPRFGPTGGGVTPTPQSAPGRAAGSRAFNVVVNVNGAGDAPSVGREVARQVARLADNSGVLFDTV